MTETHCGVKLPFDMKWERKYKLIHTFPSFVFKPTTPRLWKASKLAHVLMLLICLWELPA